MGDGDYKDEWDELEKKLDAPSADAPADDEDPKKPGEKRDRRDRDRDVRRDRGATVTPLQRNARSQDKNSLWLHVHVHYV